MEIPADLFQTFLQIILIILLTMIVSKIITRILNKLNRFDESKTAIYLIKEIIVYIIYFIGMMYFLKLFGINLYGTLLSLGIVGIAVSFAAKDIISNLFSGIILILGKSIKVGDTIEIEGNKGTIESISLRSTVIVDNLGVKIHIPNSTLTNNPYKGFKSNELRRVDLYIGLPLNIDVEDFKDYIIKKIVTYDTIDSTIRPNVFVNETSFIQVKLKVSFWVKDYDSDDRWKLIISARDKYKVIITNDIREYIVMMGEKNE